jgi:hypothetical protein
MTSSLCATYESAGMRKYCWGRTETCRSVNTRVSEYVNQAESPLFSKVEKQNMARKAIENHSSIMSNCLLGNGIDRHLLGLRLCLKENETLPPFFMDPVYKYSCHWTLSTSQIPSETFIGYGWGQVVDDGLGIAYMVQKSKLYFNVVGLFKADSNQLSQARIFVESLKGALDILYELFSDKPVMGRRLSDASSMYKSTRNLDIEFSSSSRYGFSLAYPQSLGSFSPTGVIGDDVCLIDFDLNGTGRLNKLTQKISGFFKK